MNLLKFDLKQTAIIENKNIDIISYPNEEEYLKLSY